VERFGSPSGSQKYSNLKERFLSGDTVPLAGLVYRLIKRP
jgi:hypothetical protein